MNDIKNYLVGLFAVANAALVTYFGAFTPLLILVLLLMLSDLATRVYAASIREDEKVESKKVFKGIYKKLGMCFLIFLSLVLDAGLKQIAGAVGITIFTKIFFTALTLAWIFVREFISNLENLDRAGIELPSFIVKALNIAKDKIDKVGDEIIGGNENENIN